MNALVTGATKGIGKAIAQHLAANKYNLALCARNANELNQLCTELQGFYPQQKFICLPTDCAKAIELKRFADFVKEHFSSLDVLINNAGLYVPAKLLDEDESLFDQHMKLNVHAAYYLSKFFGREMRDRKSGHIFNICSIASLKPVVSAGSYSVSKFALLGLSKVLREELMPHKVKVTAVIPGATLTDSWKGTSLPTGRFVNPEDVAGAIINCLQMTAGANVDEIIIRPVLGEV